VPTPRPTPADEVAFALRKAIRAERVRRDLTQQDLADRLGKPRRTVSDIETGERTVTASELPDICEALGCTLAALLSEAPEARRKLGI
jgi:transcriptional regulator with XRE-family HTH domain